MTVALLGYVYLTASKMEGGLTLAHVVEAATGRLMCFFPLSGWATGAVFGVIGGSTADILLFSLLTAAGIGGMIVCFMLYQPDYYEDVLQNTETTYAVQQAAKEGRVVDQRVRRARVTERSHGLRRGFGASTFFYKQLKEKQRSSRLIFVDLFTLITIAICLAVPLLFGGGEGDTPNFMLGVALVPCVYLLFFSNATGSWSREMAKPYLYLAPVSPLKKLLWATMMSLLKPLVEGALAFGIGGIVAGASPLNILLYILIYFSFGAVFTAVSVAAQRLLGQTINKGLIMLFYMLFLILVLLPGLVAAGVLAFALQVPKTLAILPVLAWNLLVSAGIFALCRNALHTMES